MNYSHVCLLVGMVLLAPSMTKPMREVLGLVYILTAIGYGLWGSFK